MNIKARYALHSSSGGNFIDDLTDTEIGTALKCGRMAEQSEPGADTVCYDRCNSQIIVDLTKGCSFPSHLSQRLKAASDDELKSIEILGAGYGLHWEGLDVDLSVPGLLAGLLGTKSYMVR